MTRMTYLSGVITEQRHPMLGFLVTPDMGVRLPPDTKLAADNSCFSNPADYNDARYERFLLTLPTDRTLFATAPDVVADHEATIARSVPMLRLIRALGLPAAFVAQDGWAEDNTPWDEFDVLFVGGTDHFKFRGGQAAVVAAKQRGKRTHMGRVNGFNRLSGAAALGIDSVDGTFLKFGPDKNWPRLVRWFDKLNEQRELL